MRNDIKFPEVYPGMFWAIRIWDMAKLEDDAYPPGKYLVVELRRTTRANPTWLDKVLRREPQKSDALLRWNAVTPNPPSVKDIEDTAQSIWDEYIEHIESLGDRMLLKTERAIQDALLEHSLKKFEGIY